jgi:hypothetical protein
MGGVLSNFTTDEHLPVSAAAVKAHGTQGNVLHIRNGEHVAGQSM